MPLNLQTRVGNPRLTHAEVDENWTDIQTLVNANETNIALKQNSSYTPAIPNSPGEVARTVESKLNERVSVKDFGAVGDGVTDDTTAFENAIGTLGAVGKTIYIPHGTYKITRSIKLEASDPNVSPTPRIRNFSFIGDGGGNNAPPSVYLKYEATSSTDPSNFQNGLFHLLGCIDFHFENINFHLNSSAAINQIIKVGSESPSPAGISAINVTFRNCGLSANGTDTPSVAGIHIYNTLQFRWEGGWITQLPVAMKIGEEAANTTGIAGGFVGRCTFDNILFTGDVVLVRTSNLQFNNCAFGEKYASGGSTVGAKITDTGTGKSQVSIGFNNCEFGGVFGTSTPTDYAIDLSGEVNGFVLQNCSVTNYVTCVRLAGSTTGGVHVVGNSFRQEVGSGPNYGIELASSFKGDLWVRANHMTAGMEAISGSKIVKDNSRSYPLYVNLNKTSNQVLTSGSTWDTILSTTETLPQGFYRFNCSATIVNSTNIATFSLGVTIDGTAIQKAAYQQIPASSLGTLTFDTIFEVTSSGSKALVMRVLQASGAAATVNQSGPTTGHTSFQIERVG